ncbi:putative cyclase [Stereum hirsutum FP-91666 SS1]|uniref:putative cyclase n=1 Tax=Stereum hirsutum (strain FP-91666) TaxID=721885 RepID=UPI000444A25C|nr:putative cyclase [Stereum hirsutum FP-91666 SS1]EIM80724.1 putative cyclase [Stereum hirsutum FP-91666 SS1]
MSYGNDDHPEFFCKSACSIAEHGSNVTHISLGSHTGTHIDAPIHFIEGAATVTDLDLKMLVAPAVVVDVRGKKPRSIITWQDLEKYEERLTEGVMLILCTGWSKYWGEAEYQASPRLDVDAARRVLDRGVRVLGIDTLSPDGNALPGEVALHPVHKEVLGREAVIAENLNHLDELLGVKDPIVSILPLRLDGCDGSPIRAVAWPANAKAGL